LPDAFPDQSDPAKKERVMAIQQRIRLAVWATCCLVTSLAFAGPIALINPDFEFPSAAGPTAIAGGNIHIGSIPGWGVVNAGGVFEPDFGTEVAYPAAVQAITDDQVAYSTDPGFGLVSQLLPATITYQANAIYTLRVDVGHRNATQFLGGFGFYRLNNPFPTPVSFAYAVDPGEGNFTRQTHVLVGSDLLPNDFGNRILIGLFGSPNRVVDFDNVTLNISTIPEPATVTLAIAGVAASAAAFGRRRG
jgi:hypothetical protein